MKDKTHSELDALIDACLDDSLSEAEADRLSALIEESPEARERYWEMASIHGMLEQSIQKASLKAITGEGATNATAKPGGFFRRHPLTTAAAGAVFGIFSATMVFAYSPPFAKVAIRETVEVFFESFEDQQMEPSWGFPKLADVWYGNFSVVSPSKNEVQTKTGKSVAKFVPVPTRKFSYAWYIIDLENYPHSESGQSRQLKVAASFGSSDPTLPAHYQIRLAAFRQEPSAVRKIWNDEDVLFDSVLQHVGRNVVTQPEDEGWQELRTSLEIPRGARSLVISIGAAGADGTQPDVAHFLDAVKARLVVSRKLED